MEKNTALSLLETGSIDANTLLKKFKFQPELTQKLDAGASEVTQALINEIILWKVNRYALMADEDLTLLNKISTDSKVMDLPLTRDVLERLLRTKGIKLPMASSILRFRNPHIYQIIDQRVYRFVCEGEPLKSPKKIEDQLSYYLAYLDLLRKKCDLHDIDFRYADRILYQADREQNSGFPLSGY